MRYHWMQGRREHGRGPYAGDFEADHWGYYGGGSRYWSPGFGVPEMRGRGYGYGYGRDYHGHPPHGAPVRSARGYDRDGGYMGRMLARGWGYRNDAYDRHLRRPRHQSPFGWRGYDRGW